MGYRSVHIVAKLGKRRKSLPEYAQIANLPFEIQIRTILQHAWAELAHDGSYKFSGELPAKLQRRLNLQAGALELIDEQLEEIAQTISSYEDSLETPEKLEAENVNSLSLERLFRDNIPVETEHLVSSRSGYAAEINELRAYGVTTIGELTSLVCSELKDHWRSTGVTTPLGFVRDIMLYSDIDKYFSEVYKNSWQAIDPATRDFLATKYGAKKIEKLLKDHRIFVEGEEEDAD